MEIEDRAPLSTLSAAEQAPEQAAALPASRRSPPWKNSRTDADDSPREFAAEPGLLGHHARHGVHERRGTA